MKGKGLRLKEFWAGLRRNLPEASRRLSAQGLVLAGSLVLAQASLGGGSTGGLNIVDKLTEAFCPVIQFLAGPLVWIAIFVAFAIGIVLLVAGGRRAIYYMLVSLLAAVLFLAGKEWIEGQLETGNAQVEECIR